MHCATTAVDTVQEVSAPEGLRLESGLQLRLEPATPAAQDALEAMYGRISPASLRRRYLSKYRPAGELTRVCRLRPGEGGALLARALALPRPVVAVGYYLVDPESSGRRGDLALLVEDALQGLGVGKALLAELLAEARGQGVRELDLLVAADNLPALRLFQRHGARWRGCDAGAVELVVELD